MTRAQLLCGVLAVLACFSTVISAQTTWTGAASSAWGDPANWTNGVPNASTDATIAAATALGASTAGEPTPPQCRALAIEAGANLVVDATAPLEVYGALSGVVAGNGTVRLLGTTTSDLSAVTCPQLEIDRGSGTVTIRGSNVTGNLTLTSGVLRTYSADTLRVTGDALMLAGTLTRWSSGGVFDVDGDATFAGTSVTAPPNTMRFAGNLSTDAAFAPTSGTVVFDGAGAQSFQSSTGTSVFSTLTITGPAVTASNALRSNGILTVNGALALGANTLDANSNVNGSGTLDLGTANHTFAGNFDLRNATLLSTGDLVFDGSTGTTAYSFSHAGTVHAAKTGNGLLTIRGTVTVGTLRLTSGTLRTYSGDTLHVTGDAQMLAGTLTRWSSGVFDVDGDATFAGTSVTTPPDTMRFAGNLSTDAAFAPTSGTVVFDGAGAQSFQSSTGTSVFSTLTITGPAVTASNALRSNGILTVNGALALGANTLDANSHVNGSGTLDLGTANHTFAGNFDLRNATLLSTGDLVFDGSTGTTAYSFSHAGTVHAAKTGNGLLTIRGTVTVGTLRLTSGTLRTYSGDTLHVTGDAQMLAGILTRWSSGVFDVDGDATFAGTSVTTPPDTMRFAGNLSTDAAFAPTSGTVVFDGAGAQSFQSSTGTSVFSTLTITGPAVTASNALRSNGILTVNGALALGANTLDANSHVNGSGTLDLGTANHTFAGNFDLRNATLLSTGDLVFDGSTGTTAYSFSHAGTVHAAKTGNGLLTIRGTVTVGTLRLTSGTLRTYSGDTLHVTGDAQMLAGTLTRWSSGVFDVDGNATFAGTSVTAPPDTMRFAGNLSTDDAFAPTSGTVVFDGAGAQSFQSSTGTSVFSSLLITGPAVTAANSLQSNGTLTVNGALALGANTLDANSHVSGSGTLDLGTANHTFAGNFDLRNATLLGTGDLTLDGSTSTTAYSFTHPGALHAAKTGNGLLTIRGTVTVGTFRLESGTLRTYSGDTLHVTGDAQMLAGTLTRWSSGVFDVDGDVTFAGTTVTTPPDTIRCAGDWSADAAFAPTSGSVVLDGTGAMSAPTPGTGLSFATLRLENGGTRTVGSAQLSVSANSLTIATTAVLDLGQSQLSLTCPTVSVDGSVNLDDGALLELAPTCAVTINTAGALRAVGIPGTPATIRGLGGSGYGLTIHGGLTASNVAFEDMGASGVVVSASATLAPAPDDLRVATFRNPAATGAVLLNLHRTAPTELRYTTFDNPLGVQGAFNVTTPAGGAQLTFVNFAGNLAGDGFESDPSNLIEWAAPQSTDLLSYTATPGVEEVTLDWVTGAEPEVESFVLGRSQSPTGPFATIATLAATGPTAYQVLDPGLTAGVTYYYRLAETIPAVGTQVLGVRSATPLPATTQLAFDVLPTPTVDAGTTWPAFSVRIEDSQGNLVPSATDPVTLVTTGPLSGTLTQLPVNGIATFADLSATQAGPIPFDLVSGSLTGLLDNLVTVEAAAPQDLLFDTPPASPVTAGGVWPAFSLRIEDTYGNLVTSYTDLVAVSINGGTGTLNGDQQINAVGGIATFDSLTYDTAESVTVACAAAGLGGTNVVTAPVTVEAAAPTQLVFVDPSPTQTAGVVFDSFSVEIRDQLGNLASTAPSETITLSLASGTDTLWGTLTAIANNGVASFSDISYTKAEVIALDASSASGLLPASSAPITVEAAAAATLQFATPPPAVASEDAIVPAIQVQVVDVYDNVVTQAVDPVTLAAANVLGTLGGTTSQVPNNGVATFGDLVFDTPQTVDLAFDSTSLASLPHVLAVIPFHSDLALPADAISVTPASPSSGIATQVSIAVKNGGQINATAAVQLYRGDPDLGGVLLGQTGGVIGVGDTATYGLPWTPGAPGLHNLFAVVVNQTPPEATPGDNRAALLVAVDAPPEQLGISGGERLSYPGDNASVTLTVQNTGAGATAITQATTNSSWLSLVTDLSGVTLAPGESVAVLADLSVPPGTPAPPLGGQPDVHPISVDVATATGIFSGSLDVKLFDQPAASLTVRLVDAGTSAVIGGGLVSFQDLPGVVSTDGTGEVTVNLPPGARGVAAYKQGYLAVSRTFLVPDGASTVEIPLTAGATLEVAAVTPQPLSSAEVQARGVNINDPINNHIVDFVVAMEIGDPIIATNVEVPRTNYTTPTRITISREVQQPPGGGGDKMLLGILDFHGGGRRTETWMIIAGDIWTLKSFYDVTMVVVNRSDAEDPTDVQLRNVTVALDALPGGLGLPDLDGVPQSLTRTLADLDAGDVDQASWVVRGDEPGTYAVSATTNGDLYGFGTLLSSIATAAVSDAFVVTLPLLACDFQTPTSVTAGGSFPFGVTVTNQGATVANLVRVNVYSDNLVECALAPTQSEATLSYGSSGQITAAAVDLGDLDPGTSGQATFDMISLVSGQVLRLNIETGCGEPTPHVEVLPDPPTITSQPQDLTVCEGAVATFSVAASGAVPIGYQWRKDGTDIAGATTPSLSLSPVSTTDAGSYDVLVTNPGGSVQSQPAVLTVQAIPQAAFTSDLVGGSAPLMVSFTDLSTGTVDSWLWSFGDGTTSTAQHPVHTYAAPGPYDVSLTATGACGASTETKNGYITIVDPAPVAAFSATPTSGPAPLAVSFTDQSSGAITAWSWSFGDGSASSASSPQHVYTTPGTYSVSLTVSGPGGTDTATRAGYITVDEPPPVILSFDATPSIVSDGDTVTLVPVFSGGTGVIDQGVGAVTSGQAVTVTPTPGATTAYTLTVTNGAGVAVTATAAVTSYPLPVITSFTSSASIVTNGTAVDLAFVFANGTGQLSDGVTSQAVSSGVSLSVTPPDDATTTYTLVVTNPAGASVQAVVSVQAVPPPNIESFVASPTLVINGETSVLTARFSGGQGVITPGPIPVTSEVPVTVTPPPDANTLYVLAVTSPTGETVMAAVTVTAVPALPQILSHPQDQTVAAGADVTLSVVASGSNLSYQWCKDGIPLTGETQSTLFLASVNNGDAGRYTAKVSNAAGTVASNPGVLTVLGTCPDCDGDVVRIDQDLVADFNTSPPTWQGDPALAPYVSFDTSGPTPDTWRLIVDTGTKRLEVIDGATITTGTVATRGKQRPAPGVRVQTSCTVFLDDDAAIDVHAHNAQAGDLEIIADGEIDLRGVVVNRAQTANGRSGRILIASRCGDVKLAVTGLVRSDAGGDVHVLTGGDAAAGRGGDISINGLVEAIYRAAPAPAIRVASFDGKITVTGTTLKQVAVQGRRISTTGVVVRTDRDNIADPGRIEMQAQGDIVVLGNTIQHFAFPNPGTIAVKMLGNHGGGQIDIRSLGGRIVAADRAFDNVNHDNASAVNRLWAALDINLFASGAINSTPVPGPQARQMPVVDVSMAGNAQGGINEIRSFGGQVALLGADTLVLATAWSTAGVDGTNLLTSCTPLANGGTVLPADPVTSDDAGMCAPAVPPALFSDASGLGAGW